MDANDVKELQTLFEPFSKAFVKLSVIKDVLEEKVIFSLPEGDSAAAHKPL